MAGEQEPVFRLLRWGPGLRAIRTPTHGKCLPVPAMQVEASMHLEQGPWVFTRHFWSCPACEASAGLGEAHRLLRLGLGAALSSCVCPSAQREQSSFPQDLSTAGW